MTRRQANILIALLAAVLAGALWLGSRAINAYQDRSERDTLSRIWAQ